MAAVGAVNRLREEGVRPTLYDKNDYPGGHTATFSNPTGFLFDDGPHISFTKHERLQNLFAENIGQKYEVIQARVNNYWRGHWIKHPAQCNLYGLPPDLVSQVLEDFVGVQGHEVGAVANYQEWLIATYGKTFADTFPTEYGIKYHTTGPENMTTDWLGPRLYRPKLEEVLRGALEPVTPDVHYVDHFRYPSKFGFVSYLEPFYGDCDLKLSHEVTRIDPKRRTLEFASGEKTEYRHLISSMPLPVLIARTAGAPEDVREAAATLACTKCVMVNIGVDRPDISEAHWSYFYDRDIFFTRLSFPHMLSPGNVPDGMGSIQVEVYYSDKYRPLDRSPQDCIDPVLADLRRCGLLRETDKILMSEARVAPYANVIFDLDRPKALASVHGYLEDIGIAYCGRYGEWGYQWTDESFLSGESAAQKILDRPGSA
ncbi:MAG: NAD(P)-binding protein [Acidimicrobiia bacterium]|nr:NAD(P)-binding protein [Acidimicrobiia bacterium]